MNPQDPLAALHPLREPLQVGWWPPAPGWWLLLVALLLLLGAGVYFLWRRYRRNAYRRQALLQLQAIREHYLQDRDGQACITATNALLKSVAIRAYPLRDVAAISGEHWLEFLNAGLGSEHAFDAGFALAAYRPARDAVDLDALYSSAALWIQRHKAVPHA